MTKDKKVITLFMLSIYGLLFSGYLSGVTFFSSTCAFNEGCPYFFGYPACYYGFAMFLTITVFSSLLLFSKIEKKKGLWVITSISVLGILFAGYFSSKELPLLLQNGFGAYMFGLPTCALGLIFYVLIFFISIWALHKKKI